MHQPDLQRLSDAVHLNPFEVATCISTIHSVDRLACIVEHHLHNIATVI